MSLQHSLGSTTRLLHNCGRLGFENPLLKESVVVFAIQTTTRKPLQSNLVRANWRMPTTRTKTKNDQCLCVSGICQEVIRDAVSQVTLFIVHSVALTNSINSLREMVASLSAKLATLCGSTNNQHQELEVTPSRQPQINPKAPQIISKGPPKTLADTEEIPPKLNNTKMSNCKMNLVLSSARCRLVQNLCYRALSTDCSN